MEEILTPFFGEFAKDTILFVEDDTIDFEELAMEFQNKFRKRFSNVCVVVIPQYMSITNFDIEKQKKSTYGFEPMSTNYVPRQDGYRDILRYMERSVIGSFEAPTGF
jgi:hypothetical protein